MTNTRPQGFLNIPLQTHPTDDSFDTHPRSLEVWLTELPMADTGECARRIFNALREINRLIIPRKERMNVLNALRGPIHNISQVLKRHYINQNLPLSPKNKKIAELSIDLNQEIALCYKVIIEEAWTKKLTFFNRKDTIKAIHHTMYYLSNALLTTYQIYTDTPPNSWIHIHQLYLYAEENGFHKQTIKDQSNSINILPNCSIRDLYKQILLLSLISPYRLRQDIIERVYKALAMWTKDCNIIMTHEVQDQQHSVIVRLTSDVSPGFYSSDDGVDKINTRAVETSALVHRLGEYMLSSLPTKQNMVDLPDDVVKLLTMTWGGRSKRIFSRKPANNDVSITIGLSATHHLISNILETYPELVGKGPCASSGATILGLDIPEENIDTEDEPELNNRADFDKTIPVFGVSALDNHTADIWDSDFSSKSIGYDYNLKLVKQLSDNDGHVVENEESAYAAHTGSNINESAGGHCILGTIEYAADAPKVQIGELIGVKSNNESSQLNVSIGVIRRIKDSENGIELGIQKFAPCAVTVSTSKFSINKSGQKFVRSLVLPEVKSMQQPITLVTHDIHKLHDDLIIAKDGYKIKIKLTRLLESTGVFSRFEFKMLKVLNVDKNRDIQTSAGSYEDVWSLI